MFEPIRQFLTHPFGLTFVALGVVVAGLLATELARRRANWSNGRLVFAATLPLPLLVAVASAVILLISPWEDSLIQAVLMTVGLLGTFFTLLAGGLTAWLVVLGLRR